MVCALATNYLYKYRKCWNFERHWTEDLTLSNKTPYMLALFLVKLLNGLFSSCLWKNSSTRCFLLLLIIFLFFFLHSKHNRYKNKIPLSSESEMILKELENSYLSYLSVNLTDIYKSIDKYRRKVISKYCQKSLFIA